MWSSYSYEIFYSFSLSLCLSLFQATPPRTELSRNSIDKSRDPISRWPRYGHYHRVNRTTRRKRKRKRRRELVQPGPRQSSDGSCPTDAAFGEVKRKRRREKTEKERDGDSISTKTHQTVVLVSFCYVVCVCVCLCICCLLSFPALPSHRLLSSAIFSFSPSSSSMNVFSFIAYWHFHHSNQNFVRDYRLIHEIR